MASKTASTFSPKDLTKLPAEFTLPNELWLSLLAQTCPFPSPVFHEVVETLIRNPNLTSSLVFRAETFYDSDKDTSIIDKPNLDLGTSTDQRVASECESGGSEALFSPYVGNIRDIYRPRGTRIPDGFDWKRTLVRRFVPRNPQLDRDLVQTVHFFGSLPEGHVCKHLVLQIPHVDQIADIPWYHPAVRSLAIIHSWQGPDTSVKALRDGSGEIPKQQDHGTISIHYSFFPSDKSPAHLQDFLTPRSIRTAHHLLNIIHRNGVGVLTGYTKRVNHDLIIPQARFQDTYTDLKIKYAKKLIGDWREQTDPTKHVFEDLGIAAFLIELWKDHYHVDTDEDEAPDSKDNKKEDRTKIPFPGFVDIGCGNGVLVHILLSEGYRGWGFDARKRKSWDMFPPSSQKHLRELLLVPEVFQETRDPRFHSGVFPDGTFIISNHADELTPWTPVLATLSRSPFIAIPCCSHNFAGAKFRAPVVDTDWITSKQSSPTGGAETSPAEASGADRAGKGCESGSLRKPPQPSAYATLVNYVSYLSAKVGYRPEKEILRIPSTRNACILGRTFTDEAKSWSSEERERKAKEVVKFELERRGNSLEQAGMEWTKRAMKLSSDKKCPVDAH